MADQKITQLTENTSPILTDILPMVDDPGASPATQKVTLTNLSTAFRSGARVYSSATQALTANTWTNLAYDTEAFDYAGEYNTTTHIFTVTKAGLYVAVNSFALTAAAKKFHVAIYVGGVIVSRQIVEVSVAYNNMIVSTVLSLSVSDTVEFYGMVETAGGGTVQNDSGYTYGSIARLG